MIPEGWERTTLGRVARITSGGTPDRNKPEYWGGEIPWVTTGEIGNGPIISTSEHITEIGLKNSSAKLFPAGTLLMAMYGQGKTRGKIAQLKINATTNQACAAILTRSAADASFLFQNLTARYDEIRNLSNDGSQKNLSGGLLKALPILLPPPNERERIAAIMETWDRAIETVEALIANARAQKQALMQQLLPQGTTPPKKRLPGFSGEWRETTIESVASVLVSNVDKKSVSGERPVRLCNYMDVYRSDQIVSDMDFMAATATEAQIRKFGLKVGDVIITKDSETPDDIAIPTIVQSTAPDLVCGYHLAILRPKDGTDGQFLKFFFEHPRTRHFFASRANGATRFGLTVGAIETAPISLPSHAEQKEIGNVILAAETEIHRLKPILTALRQEKAALMQQLLIGKRRVKLPESEVA
jgi:type I restriction enzyme S subunit